MRNQGFLHSGTYAFSAPRAPNARDPAHTPLRRLNDDVAAIIIRACATNDLTAATDLLALLEKWHSRRSGLYGRERRVNTSAVQALRSKLERLSATRGRQAAGSPAPDGAGD